FRQFDNGDGQFRMFGMGPGGQLLGLNDIPEGVKLSATRTGDGVAKVTVEKGDQKWTIEGNDEEAIAKLPDDVRPLVRQLLRGDGVPGLGSFDFQLPEGAGQVDAEQHLNAKQKETMKRM